MWCTARSICSLFVRCYFEPGGLQMLPAVQWHYALYIAGLFFFLSGGKVLNIVARLKRKFKGKLPINSMVHNNATGCRKPTY